VIYVVVFYSFVKPTNEYNTFCPRNYLLLSGICKYMNTELLKIVSNIFVPHVLKLLQRSVRIDSSAYAEQTLRLKFLWMTPFSSVDTSRPFRATFYLHCQYSSIADGSRQFLRNVWAQLPDYTKSCHRKHWSSAIAF